MGNRTLKRAVFLDRDGVVNEPLIRDGKPYPPASIDELTVSPGAEGAIDCLHRHGFEIVIFTNQPDIARGTTSREAVERIHGRLRELLAIDEIVMCPHDDDDRCSCRKPLPGMLLDVAARRNIDLSSSFVVGDRWRDIAAGQAAGSTTIFIDRGYNERKPEPAADEMAIDITEAADKICRRALVCPSDEPVEKKFPVRPPLPIPAGETEASLFDFVVSVRVADAPEEELRAYGTHDFRRFLYTWGLVAETAGRVLELGANPYFTTMLMRRFGARDVTLANFFGDNMPSTGVQQVLFTVDGVQQYVELPFDHFNIEAANFPYPDASFDIVIFCEIIEHLLADPLRVLAEIRRVLVPGGTIVVSTPNVARIENVARLVAGANIYDPYSGHGPYGRHNREYNLHELVWLLRFAGFDATVAFTADAHNNHAAQVADLAALAPLVEFRRNDLGQYLFVKAAATLPVQPGRPEFLFRSFPEGEIRPWP